MLAGNYQYLNGIKSIAALLFCIWATLGIGSLQAQQLPTKGVPLLQNIKPVEYGHKGKIWDIDSAPNGILYMAADKGLVEFDGKNWRSFTGSDGIIRTLAVINDTLIYTGSDLDFGVWVKDKRNSFNYTSLYPFKEDLLKLSEEFWGLHVIDKQIFFVSSSNIYVYENNNLTKIPAPAHIKNSFKVDGAIYLNDAKSGLHKLVDLSPVHLFSFENPSEIEIAGLFEDEDGLVLVSRNQGLFLYKNNEITPFKKQLSTRLKSANVFSFERIEEDYIAFGTVLQGLFITNRDGKIIHQIGKGKGLQNNTVLSLHYSPGSKLWLGLDYGMSSLDLSSKTTFIYDFKGEFGTGYSAVLNDKTFYLGTNQGLYTSDWSKLFNDSAFNFDLIDGTDGQVWELNRVHNTIWMSHDQGLFLVNDNSRVQRIGDQKGFLTIQAYKNLILAGTYNGISIFSKKDGEWQFLKHLELILGSCSQIAIESENTIWFNILNYGVIRATIDENLTVTDREIFQKREFRGVGFSLKNQDGNIEVHTDSHIYTYNQTDESFSLSAKVKNGGELADVLSGIAEPLKLDSVIDFYPVYNGFALRDNSVSNEPEEEPLSLIIRKMEAFNNEKRSDFFNNSSIAYDLSNIQIEAIVPNRENVVYQYKLNASKDWSEWTSENTFSLFGLQYGSQKIWIRAKADDTISTAETLSFSIDSPWYKSWYMYLLYVGLFSSAAFGLYLWQNQNMARFKEKADADKRRLIDEQEERYLEQIRKIEQQSLKSESEELKLQLRTKTFELATKAKENQNKIQVLQQVKEKIKDLENNPKMVKKRVDEIRKIIESNTKEDDNTFELQLDELHQKLYKKLQTLYPDLTNNDLRLCAYIKIGFNAKETADMLNIKPSSVYINRSRLRKKLNMDSDEDLQGFLNSIAGELK